MKGLVPSRMIARGHKSKIVKKLILSRKNEQRKQY